MRIAGLDYGLERTGIAVSDPSERVVFAVGTFALGAYPTRKIMLDALVRKLEELNVEACVMGLPLPESGEETLICRQIRNVTKRLFGRLQVPWYYMNEYCTSRLAWQELAQMQVAKKKRTKVLDQQAAVLILEAFLALEKRPEPAFRPDASEGLVL